jgi:hypothetical protein
MTKEEIKEILKSANEENLNLDELSKDEIEEIFEELRFRDINGG